MNRLLARLVPPLAVAALLGAGESLVDRVAASVNDVAIPESAVRRAMRLSALTPQAGESDESFRGRVLDALIDQQLQYEEALRFGPVAPDAAEVAAATQRLRDRLKAEGKDPDVEFSKAGMTADDVRASIERQLVVQRYLRERFRPVALADEERARAEYNGPYSSERRAAGLPIPPFETVAEEMRSGAQQRAFGDEVERWSKDLREKARISIYRTPTEGTQGTPVVLATVPAVPSPTRTPTPVP